MGESFVPYRSRSVRRTIRAGAAGPGAGGVRGRRGSSQSAGGRAVGVLATAPAASSVLVAAKPLRRPIPPKFYRIGEVITYSGMSRQTIHNYTIMGLLRETQWTQGGHRLYDESVFERLDKIAELKAVNKTMHDILEFFRGQDGDCETG